MILEVLIGAVIGVYFGALLKVGIPETIIILAFSVVGIAGSMLVAWFGIRVNTFANSRTAFAALKGKPFPCYEIPLKAGMSIGMMLISIELLMMLVILLFVPHEYAGKCFIGFAIGESLGASALRIAGGNLHEDRRHRLGPHEDRLQHQGRRRAATRASSPIARATMRVTRSVLRPTASRPTASPASRSSRSSCSPSPSPTPTCRSSCWCGSSRCASS